MKCIDKTRTNSTNLTLLTSTSIHKNKTKQVYRHLIATNLPEFLEFSHKLLQRMNFKHVYLFLVLSAFIGKFIPNINNEHAQDYSCPGQL